MLQGGAKNPVIIYILEFLVASSVAYLLLTLFPEHSLLWSMTSIALVLTPKSEESIALIYGRITANILGSLVGFVIMLIHEPNIYLFCFGAVATVLLSKYLKVYTTVRSAVAALVLIMIPAYHEPRTMMAIERILCVIVGCVIALLVTILFDLLIAGLMGGALQKTAHGEQKLREKKAKK
jgi:uncharacterized membrane protein YccC